MNISVEKVSNKDQYKKLLEFVKNNELYVGIPQETSSRKEDNEITNAEILFIQTYGSPVNNIPPRPVIEPAIENSRERISKMMSEAVKTAIEGNYQGAIDKLKAVGMLAQNKCRAWFVDERNGWPPNAPSVYRRKLKKGSTDPKPLIDTGEMRKSITYFVKTRGGRVK